MMNLLLGITLCFACGHMVMAAVMLYKANQLIDDVEAMMGQMLSVTRRFYEALEKDAQTR